MGFSRQDYWSGLSFPSAGDRPDPGTEPMFPAFQADSLPPEPPWVRNNHIGACYCYIGILPACKVRASFFQMESLPSGQSPPMWDKVGIQHYFPIFPRLISFFHVNSDWLLWKNSQLVIKLRPLLKRSGKGAPEKTSLGCIFHEVSWKKKSWSSSLIHN